jgi:hypothetical protein
MLDTLQSIISEAKSNKKYIYRGCAFEKYDLVPTLARKVRPEARFSEFNIYSDILQKAAEQGFSQIGMDGTASDLSQHYGLSTSYLDWSYSVYVALYFAFTSYIKQFVDENILNPNILHEGMDLCKLNDLRHEFNKHEYCIYRLNKKLYDELRKQYPKSPLIVHDTNHQNERMESQQGLLSSIDSTKVNDKETIQSSQIQILADWFQSNNPDDSVKQSGKAYSWHGKTLLDKKTFELPQRDRNCLQKYLKENGAVSTKLFPDFEGVKKNVELSEDYSLLIGFQIAYHEGDLLSNAISAEDVSKLLNGADKDFIKSRLKTDNLEGGEFSIFAD